MNDAAQPAPKKGFSGLQVTGIVIITVLVTILAGWWLVRTYLFPSQLEPVELSQTEQVELGRKLKLLGVVDSAPPAASQGAVPEPYSEEGASRDVSFSERELNGLIARDPELASNLALDLSEDLVSFTLLVDVPPDFPVMAGRTVRVNGGAEVSYLDGKPVVMIKGVSLMGVPVPNAWLGNLKNVDLVQQFGDQGFWRAFAAGVDSLQVREGRLDIRLKE